MTTEGPIAHARFRSMSQVSDHQLEAELHQLNHKSHRLDAELLLYLGELDQRRLYREEACASAFEFCVSRMGYSEDVAYKRVGAARLMRQFPRIYDLLAEGQLHLTALMLLKPHLTEANQKDWLLAACNKSKREVERLVASRCPKPDAKASVRRLPVASRAPIEPSPQSSAVDCEDAPIACAPPTSAPAAPERDSAFGLKTKPIAAVPRVGPVAQVAPLSSSTYRVTFTASEQLKQKLDRARELLSHCIPPSDLPALIERALDQLLEREQTRRYGAIPKCKPTASPQHDGPAKPQTETVEHSTNHDFAPAKTESVSAHAEVCPGPNDVVGEQAHLDSTEANEEPCPIATQRVHNPLDSDPTRVANDDWTGSAVVIADSAAVADAVAKADGAAVAASNRRRQPRAYVRRAVFERDAGQCTFVDHQGRRCSQRHFLEFDHIEAYAIGGTETFSNLRLRCREHNALEAERLFGQNRVKGAITHARQRRTR